jgi:hypothetical protein
VHLTKPSKYALVIVKTFEKDLTMRDIKHKRYTKAEAFWKKAIEEYQEGTQSIKEFCQVRELREGTFYKWKKRLQLREASVSPFIPWHCCLNK